MRRESVALRPTTGAGPLGELALDPALDPALAEAEYRRQDALSKGPSGRMADCLEEPRQRRGCGEAVSRRPGKSGSEFALTVNC